ncbi:FUSC family protein [Granulicella tundricola]|nr:FUSC family protein [Granulicella tundricola]
MRLLRPSSAPVSLRSLQWSRGLRGGLAVGVSIVGSHLLGRAEGWVALGSFYVVLADNGGPYRSRLKTIATLLVGGLCSLVLGALASGNVASMVAMTLAVCFAYTFARALSQYVASTSVLILVIYFAMLSPNHQSAHALGNAALLFCCGWLWGASLSLFFWPLDPFRPARQAVAQCYRTLSGLAGMVAEDARAEAAVGLRTPMVLQHRRLRLEIEAARRALEQTKARSAVRTIRARNLSVLLELADIFFASTIRAGELLELASGAECERIREWTRGMGAAYAGVAEALVKRPQGDELGRMVPESEADVARAAGSPIFEHLAAERRDGRETLLLAVDAVDAIWSGVERIGSETAVSELQQMTEAGRGWADAVRSNWSFRSVMMKHALRVALVGAADAVIMRVVHVNHGFWLAMTSLIVLQPNVAHTMQRSLQRVRGTLAGGLLAALLALSLQWPPLLIAVIVLFAVLTCAFYAVDYGWYCFFLTPTFVLMSLPRVHDWHFAAVRVGLTLLGVAISLGAMRVLWPETERMDLGRFFANCCAAEAAYARAILALWPLRGTAGERGARQFVASRRRACGLASNDAEECVERILLEPVALSRRGVSEEMEERREERWQHELTFVTYTRRLTQSLLSFARLAHGEADTAVRLEALAVRLEGLGQRLASGDGGGLAARASGPVMESEDLPHVQIRRLERQVGVLEGAVSAAHLL